MLLFDLMFPAPTPAISPAAVPVRERRRLAATALAVAGFVCAAFNGGPAHAAATSSTAPELSQQQILSNLYGGTFTRTGDDFSNGEVDVRRLSGEGEAEQIFQSEVVSAKAVASFARNSQTFGLMGRGGQFNPLFSTAGGSGLDASGAADLRGDALLNTIFALQTSGTVHAGTGPQALNYAVSSVGSTRKSNSYLSFWEDTRSVDSDFDYNDLVVELANTGPGARLAPGAGNVLIPLPAAAWSGLSVLGGMGAFAGLRKFRNRLRMR